MAKGYNQVKRSEHKKIKARCTKEIFFFLIFIDGGDEREEESEAEEERTPARRVTQPRLVLPEPEPGPSPVRETPER